jgi:hypothetical protein
MRAGMRVACGRVCDAAESSDLSSSEKPHVINVENQSQSKREKVSVNGPFRKFRMNPDLWV